MTFIHLSHTPVQTGLCSDVMLTNNNLRTMWVMVNVSKCWKESGDATFYWSIALPSLSTMYF